MKAEMNAHVDGDLGAPVQDVAQEAIDSVAATYAHDPQVDVEEQLRAQLASRGITGTDQEWLDEVVHEVRAGHPVRVGRPDGSVTRREEL
jgi:hypothetical protein